MIYETLEQLLRSAEDPNRKIMLLVDPSLPSTEVLALIQAAPEVTLTALPENFLKGMSKLSFDIQVMNNQQNKVRSDTSGKLMASPLFGGFAECDLASFEAETRNIFDHFLSHAGTTRPAMTALHDDKTIVSVYFDPYTSLLDASVPETVDLLMTYWNNIAKIIFLIPHGHENTKASSNIIKIMEKYPDNTVMTGFDLATHNAESFNKLVKSWLPEEKLS